MDQIERGKAFVDNYLQHYSSQYYDPAEAHAYYEKNKQLKGRQSAAPEITKNSSKADRKNAAAIRKKEAETRANQQQAWQYAKTQIDTKRNAALAMAEQHNKDRIQKLQDKAAAQMAHMQSQMAKALERINKTTPIPQNASPQLRALLTKSNKSRTARATKARTKQMQDLGANLSKAVSKARTDYAKNTSSIRKKYKAAADKEHANIQAKVK